jgi:hypothetical protein
MSPYEVALTQERPSALEVDMDDNTQEAAYFDYLDAREAALNAAAGHFAVANVPTEHLRVIAANKGEDTISLAARVVLHQRGEAWRV